MVGGITLLCAFYIGTLDFDKDMKKAAFANTTNIAFFVYARFIQFPYHSYYLMKDVRADPGHSALVVGLFSFYFVFMSIYNLGAFAKMLPQGIRFVRRAIDGVTVIDDGPIAPPKEGRMKARRSSLVLRMLQRVDADSQHPTRKTRRVSSRFSAALMPDNLHEALDFDLKSD